MPCTTVRKLSEDVDLLTLHALDPARYPFLLESAAVTANRECFDILFAFPQQTVSADSSDLSFLDKFEDAWNAERVGRDAVLPFLPFNGGWFLYLGYELAAEIEPGLRLPTSGTVLPAAMATRIPAAIIRDRRTNTAHIVAESGSEHLIADIERDLRRANKAASPSLFHNSALDEDDGAIFLKNVMAAKDYILAGDIYQANLSRAWRTEIAPAIANATLYDHLRRANPAPFAALAAYGDKAILSSSPERLVSVRNGKISARPIAGTRPRGQGAEDETFMAELIAHPKERAEHVMLVDLARNDLSRVAVPGSVKVDEMMSIESYTHVHHIVSNVTADCLPGITPADVIRAVFPGGTITGCPKVRAMEIIAELEGTSRGAYTGALGYVCHDGAMDLNILIRTMVRDGAQITFRTGAGIVSDSVPEKELAETRAKARGLIRALTEELL